MVSNWWNDSFDETYIRFTKIFGTSISISLLVRFLMSFYVGFDILLGSPQKELTIVVVTIVLVLGKLKSYRRELKQAFIYILIEILNIFLKQGSLSASNNETLLYCIESTLITLLFQANIFQSIYVNLIICLKHLFMWYYYEYFNSDELIKPIVYGMTQAIIIIWWMFEEDKRSSLYKARLAKVAETKALNQLSNLLKLFPEPLVIINTRLEIQYSNDKFTKILETSQLHSLKQMLDLRIENEGNKIIDKLNGIYLNSEQPAVNLGVTKINANLYEWTCGPISWEDSFNYMILLKDVTKIVLFERISTENKSKTAIIRSVSHELRTPINSILMLISQIIEEVPEFCIEKLTQLRICAKLLNFQVEDILDYSELMLEKFRPNLASCNLKNLLEECASIVRVQSSYKNISFHSKIDAMIPNLVFTDSLRIQKIVINLLTNALKFTNAGSVSLCAINSDNSIKISVKDTGIGIPDDRLQQIFQMFSDTSSSGLSGLGLYTSSKILRHLNSSFHVSSAIDKGSEFTFEIKLPSSGLSDCDLTDEIPNERSSEDLMCRFTLNLRQEKCSKKKHIKVLIVDDNDFNRIILANALKKKNIQFLEALNGKDAVEIVKECDGKDLPIKCVIMDCNMPVMDGWEATKTINHMFLSGSLKSLPAVVGHTAYSNKEDIQRCFDSGMISYIIKPTCQEKIVEVIKRYIKH